MNGTKHIFNRCNIMCDTGRGRAQDWRTQIGFAEQNTQGAKIKGGYHVCKGRQKEQRRLLRHYGQHDLKLENSSISGGMPTVKWWTNRQKWVVKDTGHSGTTWRANVRLRESRRNPFFRA